MREKPHIIKALNILLGVGGTFTPTRRLAYLSETMANRLYEMGYAERAAVSGIRDEWGYRLSPEDRRALDEKSLPDARPAARLPERSPRLPSRPNFLD